MRHIRKEGEEEKRRELPKLRYGEICKTENKFEVGISNRRGEEKRGGGGEKKRKRDVGGFLNVLGSRLARSLTREAMPRLAELACRRQL